MALVSGGRSTLNPNAPLFIPCYMRQVEDFSPEWWNLVTTSTWFREYWLSQHQGEVDGFFGNDEDGDVVDLLPDTIDIDLGIDEDILNMEAQYEEFLLSAEAGQGNNSSPLAVGGKSENGFARDDEALVRSYLRLSKERGPKSPVVEPPKYYEKPAKYISPKCSPRPIQQPR